MWTDRYENVTRYSVRVPVSWLAHTLVAAGQVGTLPHLSAGIRLTLVDIPALTSLLKETLQPVI